MRGIRHTWNHGKGYGGSANSSQVPSHEHDTEELLLELKKCLLPGAVAAERPRKAEQNTYQDAKETRGEEQEGEWKVKANYRETHATCECSTSISKHAGSVRCTAPKHIPSDKSNDPVSRNKQRVHSIREPASENHNAIEQDHASESRAAPRGEHVGV